MIAARIADLEDALTAPDELTAHRGLVTFAFLTEGDLHAPEPHSGEDLDALIEVAERFDHDPAYQRWRDTAWGIDGFVSSEPFSQRRFQQVSAVGEYRHLPWKAGGGLWTSPVVDGTPVWLEYLALTNPRPAPTAAIFDTVGRDLRIHPIGDRAAFAEFRRAHLTPDRHIDWSSLADQYDSVRFSWAAVIGGIVTALTKPGDDDELIGVGCASTFWLHPPPVGVR